MPAQAISKPPTTTSSKSPVQPPTVQPTALKTSVDRFFQVWSWCWGLVLLFSVGDGWLGIAPSTHALQLPTATTNPTQHQQRYDFLSAGMGAMVVTSFCFARGQDVSTALWISAAATIGAVVLNELLFSQEES